MKEHKPFSIRIVVYPLLFILIIAVYKNQTANSKSISPDTNRTHVKTIIIPPPNAIKVGELYAPYYIDEHSTLKTIINNLQDRCSGDEACEVNQAFTYVSHIPYVRSNKHRTPVEVINKNGGDCDEKAQLFAMILLETHHNCVLVYTKDHAFIAVEINNPSKMNPNSARLTIGGKEYFYAEVTDPKGYVGKFNDIYPHQFQGIYHVNEKKNIPIESIQPIL